MARHVWNILVSFFRQLFGGAEPVETVGSTGPHGQGDSMTPADILQTGARGAEVEHLQTRLKALGFYDGAIDGIYGENTVAAVRAFQEQHNLTADGQVGLRTSATLYPVYRPGSQGPEVRRIQTRLQDLDYYRGPVDGDYGSGTESAVRAFQRDRNLAVDGVLGPNTWQELLDTDEEIPVPEIFRKPLAYRCLALTGTFETNQPLPGCFSGLSGDFDGQGISFGALQWNFGQQSLQPLLQEMLQAHHQVMETVFHSQLPVLTEALNAGQEDLMSWARSIQHPVKHTLHDPWRGMFKSLGRTDECRAVQTDQAENMFHKAEDYCREYDLWSERAMALMFDIRVQNGSISRLVRAQIQADIQELAGDLDEAGLEQAKLRIIANRRAEASNPRWVEDVRTRKLCIANGEGRVHGRHYDLEGQYGLRLTRSPSLTAPAAA